MRRKPLRREEVTEYVLEGYRFVWMNDTEVSVYRHGALVGRFTFDKENGVRMEEWRGEDDPWLIWWAMVHGDDQTVARHLLFVSWDDDEEEEGEGEGLAELDGWA